MGHTIIYIPEDTGYVVLFREIVLIKLNMCLSSVIHPVLCLRQTVRDIWGYLTKKLQLWLHIKEPAWTYIFIGWLGSTFLLEINSDRKSSHLSLVRCLAHIICNIVRLVSWVCLWQIDARRHLDSSSELLNTSIDCTIYTWPHMLELVIISYTLRVKTI